MSQASNVLLLIERTNSQGSLLKKLEQYGANTVLLNGPAELTQAIVGSDVDVLVLPVESGFLPLVVARLHTEFPNLGLIVLPCVEPLGLSAQLLLTGADVCLAPDVEIPDILAYVHAVRRRLGTIQAQTMGKVVAVSKQLEQEDDCWRLLEKGWSIQAPNGQVMELTHSERQLMDAFSQAIDARLSREELMRDKGMNITDSRAVDSLISRLRRKAQAQGLALPIKSVHGWGYTFAGRLVQANGRGDSFDTGVPASVITPVADSVDSLSLVHWVGELASQATQFRDALSFAYQAQINVNTGQMSGVDIEAQWLLGDGQLYSSQQVFQLLPTQHLVQQAQECVQHALFEDIQCWWQEYGLRANYVSFKVTPDYLLHAYRDIINMARHYQIDIRTIGLDLMLSAEQTISEDILSVLNYLRSHNVRVYLNIQQLVAEQLSMLPRLSVTGIKLDTPLLQQAQLDSTHKVSLELALQRMSELGLETVVKGVDSIELRELALSMETTHYQGLLTSDSMSRDAFLLTLACNEQA